MRTQSQTHTSTHCANRKVNFVKLFDFILHILCKALLLKKLQIFPIMSNQCPLNVMHFRGSKVSRFPRQGREGPRAQCTWSCRKRTKRFPGLTAIRLLTVPGPGVPPPGNSPLSSLSGSRRGRILRCSDYFTRFRLRIIYPWDSQMLWPPGACKLFRILPFPCLATDRFTLIESCNV